MPAGADRAQDRAVALFALVLLCLPLLMPLAVAAQSSAGSAPATSAPAPEPVDPHKESSEMNHHIAGYGLIALGVLVLAAHASPQSSRLRLAWPGLFLFIGLFLVVWSDPEIWPRGDLGFNWLLFHDPSARMHKAWAVLLIVLGAVEYVRARGKLGRFWQTWAFPVLALLGAVMLLFHPHKAPAAMTASPAAHQHMHEGMEMPMDQGATTTQASVPAPASSAGHEHVMSPAMQRVELQHLWYAIVGAAVALFKFLSDGGFWRRRFVPYLWPTGVLVLGVLLAFYRE